MPSRLPMAMTAPWHSLGVEEVCRRSRIGLGGIAVEAPVEATLVQKSLSIWVALRGHHLTYDDKVITPLQDIMKATFELGDAAGQERNPANTGYPAQSRPLVGHGDCEATGEFCLLHSQDVDREITRGQESRQAEGFAIQTEEHEWRVH